MTLTGLPAHVFWALLAGAGGAVTILYLLRLRRRRVLVPFSPLWARVIEQREATSLLKALKRLFSWLVALAFVGLVVLALADPRPSARTAEAGFTAILIDASASMTARDEEPSRLERAKAEARSLIRGLAAEEQAMVVEVGAQANPLGTFTRDREALLAAVDQVKPTDTPADFRRALETVTASLRGRPHPRIVVFSDGHIRGVEGIDLTGIEVQGKLIGRTGDNVAITSFNVRRYLSSPGEYEAFLEIRNFSDRPVTCDVTISLVLPDACKASPDCPRGFECDRALGVCANPQGVIPPVSLPARGSWRRIVPNLSSDGGRLVATVEPRGLIDVQPLDNRAYAYLPPRKPARVLFVTEQNLFLEALLLLDPQNLVTKVAPEEYRAGGEWDVVIFDNVAPDTGNAPGNYVYIHPGGVHSPLENGAAPVISPVVASVRSRHPVLKWVALKDLNIAEAKPLRTESGDLVLVSGVGKGGRDTPLLVARETDRGKTLVFTFDLKRSDLPLRWSFPILITNVIAWMKGESREENSSYVTGKRWNVPVPRGVRSVTVVGPDRVRREAPVRDAHAQLFGNRAGFYELYAPGETQPSVVFAANLQDPAESDVKPAETLTLGGRAAAEVRRTAIVERDPWVYLVLLALGILAVEWVTYHRRITV